ncbi:MAG TPA: bifunctional phosphoglucose/phosphomannose isomerase [Chloroflexota bacterium]
MAPVDLDAPASYRAVDRSGMIDRILETDRQVEDAWRLVQAFDPPPGYGAARDIVILGLGGSAIGGDLVRTLVEGEAGLPITVVRDYRPPAFVDDDTLVVASSYSGNTEETIEATEAALRDRARVIAVTTGGKLADLARQRGFPLLRFQYEAQPRAALGYSFILILGLLQRLGYVADKSRDLQDALTVLREQLRLLGPDTPTIENPAKQLARELHGKVAVVYGGGVLAEVARRWKGQLNENSKTWAFFEQFPELNHNAVMGYQFPETTRDRIMVVMLASAFNHPRVGLRYEITAEVLRQHGVPFHVVEAVGATPLGHMWSAIVYGDLVSYYLALLNGVDPSAIDAINYLKARLSQA